jgi:hypothetical protein
MMIIKGKNNLSSFIVVAWTEKRNSHHSFFTGNSRSRCRLTSSTVTNDARTVFSLQAKPIAADTGKSAFDKTLLVHDLNYNNFGLVCQGNLGHKR